jgi:hypothetical protein
MLFSGTKLTGNAPLAVGVARQRFGDNHRSGATTEKEDNKKNWQWDAEKPQENVAGGAFFIASLEDFHSLLWF